MLRTQLKEEIGKLAGLRDVGETIALKIVKMVGGGVQLIEGTKDVKVLRARTLYSSLRSSGKFCWGR